MKTVALVMLVAGMTVVLGLSMAQQHSISRGIMSFRDGSFEVIGRVNSLKDHAECWVVLPDDGSLVMELEGLPEDMQIEGLRVVAKVHMDRSQPMGKCVSAIFRIIVEEAGNAE